MPSSVLGQWLSLPWADVPPTLHSKAPTTTAWKINFSLTSRDTVPSNSGSQGLLSLLGPQVCLWPRQVVSDARS